MKSARKRSRHINIRFFWVTDRLGQDNIKLAYCPTEEMIADFFTKPLQGVLFRNMRDVIMGHTTRNILRNEKTSESSSLHRKERVAESNINIMSDKENTRKKHNKIRKDKLVTWSDVRDDDDATVKTTNKRIDVVEYRRTYDNVKKDKCKNAE